MSTKTKKAYEVLYDLKQDLADVMRKIRVQTYRTVQEALLDAYEKGTVADDDQAKDFVKNLVLSMISNNCDTYSSSDGRVQCYEQTIKDTLIEVWRDVRYEYNLRDYNLRDWANDEKARLWL